MYRALLNVSDGLEVLRIVLAGRKSMCWLDFVVSFFVDIGLTRYVLRDILFEKNNSLQRLAARLSCRFLARHFFRQKGETIMTLNSKKNIVSSLNAAITGGIGISVSISGSELPVYDFFVI